MSRKGFQRSVREQRNVHRQKSQGNRQMGPPQEPTRRSRKARRQEQRFQAEEGESDPDLRHMRAFGRGFHGFLAGELTSDELTMAVAELREQKLSRLQAQTQEPQKQPSVVPQGER